MRLWRVDSLACIFTLNFAAPQTLLLPLPSPGLAGGEWAAVTRQGEVSFFRGGAVVHTHQVEQIATSAVRVQGQRLMLTGTGACLGGLPARPKNASPPSQESPAWVAQRPGFALVALRSEGGEIVAVPLPQPEIRPGL